MNKSICLSTELKHIISTCFYGQIIHQNLSFEIFRQGFKDRKVESLIIDEN